MLIRDKIIINIDETTLKVESYEFENITMFKYLDTAVTK